MYCPNCGNKVEEDALFCGECGTKLNIFKMTAVESAESTDVSLDDALEALTKEGASLDDALEALEGGENPNDNNLDYDADDPYDDDYEDDEYDDDYDDEEYESEDGGYDDENDDEDEPVYIKREYRKDKEPLRLQKPKKKISPILLIEIPALVLSIILFIVAYNHTFSAKAVAERYVKAVYASDYSATYDTLAINSKSDITSKEAFVTAMTITYGEAEETAEVKIGSSREQGNYSSKQVLVYATVNGEENAVTVSLKKSGLGWKVDPEDNFNILNNCKLYAPSGATVKMDGITLPDSYKTGQSDNGYDCYQLPTVFGYEHIFELSGDQYQTTTEFNGITDEGELYLNAAYAEEYLSKVSDRALDDLEEILDGAAKDKTYSEVEAFANSDMQSRTGLKSVYEDFRDYSFDNYYDAYQMVSFELSDIEISTGTESSNSGTMIVVSITGDYSYTESYTYWGSASTDVDTGHKTFVLSYISEGDDWKLAGLSM